MSGILGLVNLKQDLNVKEYEHIFEDSCFSSIHAIFHTEQLVTYKFQDNTYTISLNGQLYNIEELKTELLDQGFTFENNSDAEVLLKSYIAFGNDVIHKLNGVFGFAIWNENKEELFIARDHFGVKPFYYTILNDNFIFSSQVKYILKFPRSRNKIR